MLGEETLKRIERNIPDAATLKFVRDYFAASEIENDARPNDQSLLKVVWERLYIVFATEAVEEQLIPAVNRTLHFVHLLGRTKPSGKTLSYLRRVVRCFIWGLFPECVVMCRGALDAAFKDAVTDQVCRRLKPHLENDDISLATRITVAHDTGLINADLRDMAFDLKRIGDRTIHEDPHSTWNILAVLRDTLMIIEHINSSSP